MRRSSVLSVIAAACGLTAASAHADVWKWVDPHGQVQYSDRWVPGAQLIKSDRVHASSPSSAEEGRKPDASPLGAGQPDRQAASQAVQKDVAAARTEQCKQAKERYEKSIQARRIYRTGKNGEREYLTDDEADQERLQARIDMQQACGASASGPPAS